MITLLRRYWNDLVSYDGGFALLMMDGLLAVPLIMAAFFYPLQVLAFVVVVAVVSWRDTRATSSGGSVTRLISDYSTAGRRSYCRGRRRGVRHRGINPAGCVPLINASGSPESRSQRRCCRALRTLGAHCGRHARRCTRA